MAEDASHKATLYFLEVLMNSPAPQSITQLAGHFAIRNFTPDMRQACGANEAGLKKFLLKYPSLFSVDGNLVSQNDGTISSGGTTPHENSPARMLSDVSAETECVNYFRDKLLKKREMWIPIKSLAGHLSQANDLVRDCVGPQGEFTKWLLKHPLIFELKDDEVSLKRNEYVKMLKDTGHKMIRNHVELPLKPSRLSGDFSNATGAFVLRDKKRRPQSLHVPKDVADDKSDSGSSGSSIKNGPVPMTASEYKTVIFIKNALEDSGNIKYSILDGLIPPNLRATIGEGIPALMYFVKTHNSIFISNGDEVALKRNARLNVIITGSKPPEPVIREPQFNTGKGMIYHVTKLWAIIDLGKHEHVFIDRQIFGREGFDLTQLLGIGEMVCFNAVPAQKGSRAKWRATQVWKEDESIEELLDRVAAKLNINLDKPSTEASTPLGSIDEQIRKIIPEFDSDFLSPDDSYSFTDAAPSGAGVIPVWNYQHEFEMLEKVRDLSLDDSYDSDTLSVSVSMVAERQFMNHSVLEDSPKNSQISPIKSPPSTVVSTTSSHSRLINGVERVTPVNERAKSQVSCCSCNNNVKKTMEIGCQTVVTGEILATQLFHNLKNV